MIRDYYCPRCRRRTAHYHAPKLDDRTGDRVVRYFRCGTCGHMYSVLGDVAADRLNETRWEVEDVRQVKDRLKLKEGNPFGRPLHNGPCLLAHQKPGPL